jgi:hypothetical protein
MFSKNYFWVKPLAVASSYCHLTSGSSDLFLQDSTNPNSFSQSASLLHQMHFCFYLVIYLLKTFPTPHLFSKASCSILYNISHTHQVCEIKMSFAYMHTCLWLSLEIEYWLLDCLDWLDCEEEQGYYCNCCECASCYQGKWHTCPLPILLMH